MKRILFLLLAVLAFAPGFAQNTAKNTEDDLQHFYSTLQGDYVGMLSDSSNATLHLTPIWEQMKGSWLYLEAVRNDTVIEQKILEIVPKTDVTFIVNVYGIRNPEQFVGRWGNPNFFDGYNDRILKGQKQFVFLKTKDFEYQTNWNRRKSLKCFPSGDRIHFKFSKQDGRFYIKRVPKKSTHILGITFFKELSD